MKTSNEIDLKLINDDLVAIEQRMLETSKMKEGMIGNVHATQVRSALNLIHYLALRSEDIRAIQDRLHLAGLSSLTSSESHIRYQLQAVLRRLGKTYSTEELSELDYYVGSELIQQRSVRLFGDKRNEAIPYLMVTIDSSFIENQSLIRNLLKSGMNVARINLAHDDEKTWKKMVSVIRNLSKRAAIPCKIYMDLAGPKMRTTLRAKGKTKQKLMLEEGQKILFVENEKSMDLTEVVVTCDEPNVVSQLKKGARVLFDDGLIESKVTANKKGVATLKITRISGKKPKLKSNKGINFPDSEIELPALTPSDHALIPFVCEHADMVGYSFVRSSAGVAELQKVLSAFEKRPHIILKIETPKAVMNFPALLSQGMTEEIFGVMIARGDLAVEIGFERLSEIQEEIMWISEAAHVPVIWATQVLETLNKSGIPTRSEVTDAYRAAMAECVMLNKGDYIIEVMETLLDILFRSGGHNIKKRYTFRPMQIARDFLSE